MIADTDSSGDGRLKGDVLEVSAGTGRNLSYYELKKCNSITMVDTSAGMLGEARRKFRGGLIALPYKYFTNFRQIV